MTQQANVKYRDPEAEKALTQVLTDAGARAAFLGDREGYLTRFGVGEELRAAIMTVAEQQIVDEAREWEEVHAFMPSMPCSRSSLADFFCDG